MKVQNTPAASHFDAGACRKGRASTARGARKAFGGAKTDCAGGQGRGRTADLRIFRLTGKPVLGVLRRRSGARGVWAAILREIQSAPKSWVPVGSVRAAFGVSRLNFCSSDRFRRYSGDNRGVHMGKLIALVGGAALVLSVFTAVPAQAHGGGLDWQGGHNCRVGSCAGTYHCHQARGGICANNSQPAPRNGRYATCSMARAAGVTPIYSGTTLYSQNMHLDRDRDGVACE
jgi:hypothetical protein